MTWKPSNEPTRYDRARAAQLGPIEDEIAKMGLPLVRYRKLHTILNAIEMQIEDGGDSPEVNRLLLDALRAGLRHQVGDHQAKAALRAIDAFERAETRRWEQAKAGTLPPIELTAEERLNDLMQEGYALSESGQRTAACDRWLEAWELVKQMASPGMNTIIAFDDAHPGLLQLALNWSYDLEMELHNAGLDDAVYLEHRVRFVREFLARFPEMDKDRYINFRRAEGEALWQLGHQAEAEAIYRTIVEKYPEDAWGYIGWSDEYQWEKWKSERATDYTRAEAILLQALAQPGLEDREHVLDRLVRLYGAWGKPEKAAPFAAELEILARQETQRQNDLAGAPRSFQWSVAPAAKPTRAPGQRKRKRKRRRG